MVLDDDAQSRFDTFLAESLAGETLNQVPPDLQTQLSKGLRQKFASPPCEAVEIVLGRRVTLLEVQKMLFYPGPEDAKLYPSLICGPPPGAPALHPVLKLQRLAIVTLYTHHTNQWSFLENFILAGGLNVLADLCLHEDLHLRSQVVEIFIAITDEDRFQWHQATPAGSQHPVQHPMPPHAEKETMLRRAMFNLLRTKLVTNLLANREGSYPRGSWDCLRAFAFFVSFVRHEFCQNQWLVLAPEVLAILKDWPASEHPEEKELAQQLYKDFSRFSNMPSTSKPASRTALPSTISQKTPLEISLAELEADQGSGAKAEELSNGGSTGTSSSRPEDGLPTASPVAQDLTRDSKNLPGKIPSIDTGSEVDQLPEGDDHVGGGAPTDLDSGGASAPVVRDHNASNIAPSQSSEHDASNGSWASAEQQPQDPSAESSSSRNEEDSRFTILDNAVSGLLEVHIPGLASVQGVSAEVAEHGKVLEVCLDQDKGEEGTIHVRLPRQVDPESCRAKYSKKLQRLTVKMASVVL